jgi:hypothetical protein
MTRPVVLLLACAAAGFLAGCEADDSMPTRPRTGGLFTADPKAQDNAEHRSLEAPQRQMPTGGAEFPGQSAAPNTTADPRVVTLDAPAHAAPPAPTPTNRNFPISGFYGPPRLHAIGHTTGPVTTYTRDSYPGLIPHLPPNPGTIPMTGSTPMPGGDWAVDHSWGQGLTLTDTPHRDWPAATAAYQQIDGKHNPLYFFNLQEHLPVKQNNGTMCGDVVSTAYEVPWFYANTLALPVLMVLEPPLAQRSTSVPSQDPNFTGALPAGGSTVPAPYPGTLKWQYPFLNPDGTVKPSAGNAPATRQ